MRLNDIIGLFAALIGTTTTLLGAWSYVRNHNTKKEMIRGATAVVAIMVVILGSAWLISEATTIKVNGQEKVPIPGFLAPKDGTTTPTPASNSNQSPTATPSQQEEPTKPSSPDSTPSAAPPTQPASTPGVSITATP